MRCLLAALLLGLYSGCSSTKFVYQPGPATDGPKLPLKVAVLPFKDGTENIAYSGSYLSDAKTVTYNLAKAGIPDQIDAVTPELWAKAFADDLAASGRFRAVRFIYDSSEQAEEDYLVEGTLAQADRPLVNERQGIYALTLRASRRGGQKPVWEKQVSRSWGPAKKYLDCSDFWPQCVADELQADINHVMRDMFAEARADLVKTLATLPGSRAGEDGPAPVASPVPDSTDGEIERILKGN
jgi:hypothetical protein